jgi:hypothetical protein
MTRRRLGIAGDVAAGAALRQWRKLSQSLIVWGGSAWRFRRERESRSI